MSDVTVSTVMPPGDLRPGDDESATAKIFRDLLGSIPGENPDREGLFETPGRAARAVAELTQGYAVDVASLFTTFDSGGYDEMVTVHDVPFHSLCEHHLLPFVGRAHVSYIPDGRIVGLSKIARVVQAFARRLQVQERMTLQIADAIEENLAPAGLLVVAEAEHFCMTMRGVQASGTMTTTSVVRGRMRDQEATRAEALRMTSRKDR